MLDYLDISLLGKNLVFNFRICITINCSIILSCIMKRSVITKPLVYLSDKAVV